MQERDLVEIIMNTNSRIEQLATTIQNVESKLSKMEKILQGMYDIERRQLNIEDKYKRLEDCCNKLGEIKEQLLGIDYSLKQYDDRLKDLEDIKDSIFNRLSDAGFRLLERFIILILLLLLAFKDKLIPHL